MTGLRTASAGRAAPLREAAFAVVAAVAVLVLNAATGRNRLLDVAGDNDSVMRLVQIRDLLGGQGWFDLTQYRMGPEGGFEMHWSRLVDAPIALLLRIAELVTGDAQTAEMVVAYVWPGLLLAICLFLIIRCARKLAGTEAAVPAAVLGLVALFFMALFTPGSFDHHNVQLTLVLLVLALLLGRPAPGVALAAGAATAISLAIGMESAPLVAAIGASVALVFPLKGANERAVTTAFGAGFAVGAVAASLVAIPPSRWLSVTCDAWSGAQAGAAILAGAGLAAIAAMPALGASLPRRITALAVLAAVLAAFAIVAFPTCLADPYAGLDPLLRRYWLDWVTEAQSAFALVGSDPGAAAGYYVTPFLALVFLGFAAFRGMAEPRNALIAGLPLAAAFAVSLWQVRGAMFAVPLAAIPLAAMVALVRRYTARSAGLAPALLLAAAWLVSVNVVWKLGITQVATIVSGGRDAGRNTASAQSCNRSADYAVLAGLSPAKVLSVSNLGAPVLYNTGHRVLSGPYHRNAEGNLAGFRALTSVPENARRAVLASDVDIVAHCPGNGETRVLARNFPESLVATLEGGGKPAWLTPVEGTNDTPLQLFRVER